MREEDVIKIAIAETSVIIRSGLTTVLKRMPGAKILPIEAISLQAVKESLNVHKPDVLIINPGLPFFFDLDALKEECEVPEMKCVALMCSFTDSSLLKGYDESISLYDAAETLREKMDKLLNMETSDTEQEVLSKREKEIVICVVKGMTNKEIADKLFLSIYTVTTHRRNIARKLQIHSPAGLTIYAIVNNLVTLSDVKGNF